MLAIIFYIISILQMRKKIKISVYLVPILC